MLVLWLHSLFISEATRSEAKDDDPEIRKTKKAVNIAVSSNSEDIDSLVVCFVTFLLLRKYVKNTHLINVCYYLYNNLLCLFFFGNLNFKNTIRYSTSAYIC